jgi:hypothetical protein
MLNFAKNLFKKRVMRVRVEGPIDIKKYLQPYLVKQKFSSSWTMFKGKKLTR